MFVGAAVPLGILVLVLAGVAFGVWHASRPGRVKGTTDVKNPADRRAAEAAERTAVPGMPLAHGAGVFACKLAGTAYRQDTLAALRAELLRVPREQRIGGRCGAFIAELNPDPTNPHDPDAVSVDAPGYGTVGWLARGEGVRYLPLLESARTRGVRTQCPGEVWKGSDGSLAVRLDLATPTAVAARLRVKLEDLARPAVAEPTDADPSRHAPV